MFFCPVWNFRTSAETSGAWVIPSIETRYTDIAKVAPLAQAAEERGLHWLLGGGNSKICYIFTPNVWGDDPIWRVAYFFKWVGWNHQPRLALLVPLEQIGNDIDHRHVLAIILTSGDGE